MKKEKVTLSNEELTEKCSEWISKLCKSGGKDWTLRVPVDFNNDPDVLFSELIDRFNANNWIKVSERLPEKEDVGKQFLVYGNYFISERLGDAGREIATLLELDGEVFFSNGYRFKTTHWQLYPNAPKD